MPSQLPFVYDPPIYRVSTTLDNEVFIFDVRWNARDEAWYFDLYTSEEDLIVGGVRIILGIPLGFKAKSDSRFPNGIIVATDMANTGQEAGYYDLGDRVLVHFYSQDELDAI